MAHVLRALALAFLLLPSLALGQGAILQGGTATPGHAPMYVGSGQQGAQTVVQDSGPAGGGGVGVGLSEWLQVNRAAGTGPFGTHNCAYDNAITSPSGYHYFCFDASVQGGGAIVYGAGGAAAPQTLSMIINGVTYPFPFVLTGVAGPGLSTVQNFACWNNAGGTLLKDCGGATRSITTTDAAQPGDCNGSISAGGSATYTVTVGAVGGFPAHCRITVVNTDTLAGKQIAVNAGSLLLSPQTAMTLQADISSWRRVSASDNTALAPGYRPASTVALFASPTGVDTNDCLSAATACSLKYVCLTRRSQIDTSVSGAVTIFLVAGVYSQIPDGDGAQCSILGNAGGSAGTLTNIIGDCVTPGNVQVVVPSGIGFFAKDAGETQISCLTIAASAPNTVGFQAGQFAIFDLSTIQVGTLPTGSSLVVAGQSASVNLEGPFSLFTGINVGALVQVSSNANISMAGSTWTFNNPVGAAFFFFNQGGYINATGTVFTGAGLAGSAGTKYLQSGGGCVYTGGVSVNSLFPGSVSVPLPVGSCTDAPLATTFATLPACSAAVQNATYLVSDSNQKRFGVAITGGGANTVTAACNGSAWVVATPNSVSAILSGFQANPVGTTSATPVMAGLGCTVTPNVSSRFFISFSGFAQNTFNGDGVNIQPYFGTGAAPANGAAATGTAIGNPTQITMAAASQSIAFSRQAIVTGLTPGTTYWFDIAQYAVTGGGGHTANIFDPSCSGYEIN